MSSGTVSSRDPNRPLTVVRGRHPAQRDGERQGRPVVVVVGMHRSGTSLLSNLLHFLGVDMADTSDRVSRNNAGGFWERPDLNDLHDEVLAAIGRPIASPEHCLPFPPAWWRRKEVQAIKPRLIAFVEGELAKSGNLWGFKDPRTCRLLPLWSEIFRELDLAPIYIHAIRSPAESSVSMSLKNRLRSISATQGELMWIAYNYDILRYVALDHPTLTVNYDEWFAEGHRLARRLADALGIGEELSDDDLRECVDAVVSPDLRNHVAGKGNAVSRMPIASLLYDAMLGEDRATATGVRALKNQMSFIGLLMKSTAPIIDELVPLAQLRDGAAQTDAAHTERARTLDEEIVVLNRKLHTARAEAEALRADADVAGRLQSLDETVQQITTGEFGQRIDKIDRRLRELRVETPLRLEDISTRLAGLATEETLSPRLSAIETRLAEVAEGHALVARLDQIEMRLAALPKGDVLASGLQRMLAAFAALPTDAALSTRLEAIERGIDRVGEPEDLKIKLQKIDSRLRGIAENDVVPARLAEIEARLGMVADGRAIEARLDAIAEQVGRNARHEDVADRLDAIQARLGEVVDSEAFGLRFAGIEKRLGRAAEIETTRFDMIEARLRDVIENETIGTRLAGIEERLGRTAEGEPLATRLEAIAAQLGRAAEGEALAARFDTIEARLGAIAENEPLAATLAAIETRLGVVIDRDGNGPQFERLAAQIATLARSADAIEQAAALKEDVARLQADKAGLATRLAGHTRRARAVIAAARRDRAALARQHVHGEALAERSSDGADRLAIERMRSQRLSSALTARDAQVTRLEARLARLPEGTGETALSWSAQSLFGAAAEDYGFSGGIDRADRDGIAGWVRFAARPDLVPVVELVVEGRFVLAQACTMADDRCVFAIDWRDVSGEHAGRPAILRVAGLEQTIEGPDLVVPGGQRHRHQAPAQRAAEVFGIALPKAEKYQASLAAHDEIDEAGEAHARLAAGDTAWPTITVVVFGGLSGAAAVATIDALKAQVYANWEALCLAAPVTLEALDPRVRVLPAGSALRAASSGDLVSFVEAGDLIARGALLDLANVAQDAPGFALIYSDEDRIDPVSGVRGMPYRKGGWRDDFAATRDYVSRLALVHRDHLPLDDAIDRARVHRIVTAAARTAPDTVIHLSRVLYHRSIANTQSPAPGVTRPPAEALPDAGAEQEGSAGDRAGDSRQTAAMPYRAPAMPAVSPDLAPAPRTVPEADSDQALIDAVVAHRFFDAAWYLAQNPDAGALDEAARHFVRTGAAGGRDPGPDFSSAYYLRINSDVRATGTPAFFHYLESGEVEGRAAHPLEPNGDALRLPSRPLIAAAMLTGETRLSASPADGTWREVGDEPDAVRLGGVSLGLGADALDPQSRAALDGFARMHGWPVEGQGGEIAVLAGPFAGAALRVADLAFASDYDLRMRVDAPRGGVFDEPMRVRVHQASGDALTLCGEGLAAGDGPLFVASRTRNPFFPLLVTLVSPDGALRAATLVPFPSLFAGGAHRGEVIARPSGGCRFEDAKALSETLVRAHLADAGAPSVAAIALDAAQATGAERIFSSPVREWLALIAGVRVTFAGAPAFLSEQLADPEALPWTRRDAAERRERDGLARLTLPCDALPAVTALFGRGALAPGGHVIGTFVAADPVDATPFACVSQPAAASAGLDALQPVGAPAPFPWLTTAGGHDPVTASAETPVAIRYHAERTSNAALLLRRAPDAPGPLLALAAAPVDMIEAIVAVPALPERVPALLQSLANQALAEVLRLVIVVGRDAAAGAEPIEASARHLFGDRCRIVLAASEDIAADLDAAASTSEAAHLLFIEDVLLHDPRTLEALVTLAQAPGVASAGCLLVAESQDRHRTIVAGSGGLFPAGDAAVTDQPVFAALPCATYASAGNGFRLALVAADAWRAHGPVDGEDRAAGFAVRTLAAGLRHLTTSAVSASLREATPPVVVTASADAMPAWRSALAAAPTVRAIRT